ncbi:MAG: cation:proton antiporter, partial [Synergistetes bacterium HGW-Synergistetes-2]
KLFLIAVFFLVSNPMASHAIARACHRRTLANRPIDEKRRDDV